MSTTSTTTPIKFGVLLLGPSVQLLDVSPADVFGMLEPNYLRAGQLPESLVAMGVDIEYHYITESGEGLQQMTAGVKYGVTVCTQAPSPKAPSPLTSDGTKLFCRTQPNNINR